MARARNPEFDKAVNIQFLDWDLHGDTRLAAPRFIMLPMRIVHEKRYQMEPGLFRFFVHLIAHAAVQTMPGIVCGDVHSLSRSCSCDVRNVLPYLSELIKRQIIQEVTTEISSRLDKNRLDKNRLEGHFLLPQWVFEVTGLEKIDPQHNNAYLTRDIFGRCIMQQYPKNDAEPFDRVFAYCSKIIFNDRWLAFVQTCLRNYVRRKRADTERPIYHNLDTYFTQREWWNDFRNDDKTLPKAFNGTGRNGPGIDRVHADGSVSKILEHNISYPTWFMGRTTALANTSNPI